MKFTLQDIPAILSEIPLDLARVFWLDAHLPFLVCTSIKMLLFFQWLPQALRKHSKSLAFNNTAFYFFRLSFCHFELFDFEIFVFASNFLRKQDFD